MVSKLGNREPPLAAAVPLEIGNYLLHDHHHTMLIFKYGRRRTSCITSVRSPSAVFGSRRSYASRIAIPFAQPPFPVVQECPSPTCQCRETPAGLDIERESSLNGSMPTYAEHVIVSSGKGDWKSKLEDEDGPEGVVRRHLKQYMGPGGKFYNVSRRCVGCVCVSHG